MLEGKFILYNRYVDKYIEIERENKVLLGKMQGILKTSTS